MAPAGKTSLLVEYFCFEGDRLWSLTDAELFSLTMEHFERLGLCTRAAVRRSYVFRKTKVYPIYDLEYQSHLAVMKTYLDTFENLSYVGRPGRFRYTNQDHSLEMGILAARGIIEGTRKDFEVVVGGDAYLESGVSPRVGSRT